MKKTAIVMETWQVDMLEKFIVENMLTPGEYFIVGTADVKDQMWRIAVWFGDEAYNAQTTMNETLAELITGNPARTPQEIEVARLRAQVAALKHDTCSCCDRPVNRTIDACVCDHCYEDRLQ